MTSLFDNLAGMAKTDRARFEKIVLEIIGYTLEKLTHDENWQSPRFIAVITDKDCETVSQFTNYLVKLAALVRDNVFPTGYSFLDWAWPQYPDHDFLKDFVDNFHDFAHGFAMAGIIRSDSLMFGRDIGEMVC